MKIKGKLCLSKKTNDYMVVAGGRTTNLSEYLNTMLFENVSILIKNIYDGKTYIETSGKLLKEKKGRYLYLYHVGNEDIDSVLWELIGCKIYIDVKNISKN